MNELRAFIGVLLVVGFTASVRAGKPPSGSPRRGGTLRLATEDDPYSLDPAKLLSNHAAAGFRSRRSEVARNLCSGA